METVDLVTPLETRSEGPSPMAALESKFRECALVRSFRRSAYDPGDRLEYEVTGVTPPTRAKIVAEVERFVGGGFAGQVYRVRLLSVEIGPTASSTENEDALRNDPVGPGSVDRASVQGLEIGRSYAIKILTPPSAFSKWFRNVLYFLGYQAHFGAQVLPSAVRVGVLWQKLIRRAMEIETGDEEAVCDTYATFYDGDLGSFGEINEWIDGRIWKFETDDRFFDRWSFSGSVPPDHNSPEYVGKKRFMGHLVALLHRMGAGELARQYEWWTCKSTPNVLKRVSADQSPVAGLTAVDFRAGLTLLPFLPMSPADVVLIVRGLLRGRLVQFDRCDMKRLRKYVGTTAGFEDMQPAIAELEEQTRVYRTSQPDVTHHHLRLLVSARLRQSIKQGTITSWKSLGRLDADHARRLGEGRGPFSVLYLVSLIPGLGAWMVSVWGHSSKREHLRSCLSSAGYLGRAMRGARIETLVGWLRDGRASEARTESLVHRPGRYWLERLALSWMPPSWHRFFADRKWAWEKIREKADFTLQFLRQPAFREQFLLQEVRLGREEGMLSDAETARIESQIKDPFIQKYLKCLAVHLCTVPVTQIVMVLVGIAVTAYCLSVRGFGWMESLGIGTAAAAAIQLMPISPGSITRGVFVLYLMIRERDIKSYYIAAPVSFLHVVGYLAFPLQMVTQNPSLARFLAGRWTKSTVHIVPVFGESGALLEHGVFDLFFNVPLSLSRSVRARPLQWLTGSVLTVLLLAGVGAAIFLRVNS